MKENKVKAAVGIGNTLIDILVNEQHQRITLDMLKEIWHDISDGERQDIEYINADVYGGQYAVCLFRRGKAVLFLYGTPTNKKSHIILTADLR